MLTTCHPPWRRRISADQCTGSTSSQSCVRICSSTVHVRWYAQVSSQSNRRRVNIPAWLRHATAADVHPHMLSAAGPPASCDVLARSVESLFPAHSKPASEQYAEIRTLDPYAVTGSGACNMTCNAETRRKPPLLQRYRCYRGLIDSGELMG